MAYFPFFSKGVIAFGFNEFEIRGFPRILYDTPCQLSIGIVLKSIQKYRECNSLPIWMPVDCTGRRFTQTPKPSTMLIFTHSQVGSVPLFLTCQLQNAYIIHFVLQKAVQRLFDAIKRNRTCHHSQQTEQIHPFPLCIIR